VEGLGRLHLVHFYTAGLALHCHSHGMLLLLLLLLLLGLLRCRLLPDQARRGVEWKERGGALPLLLQTLLLGMGMVLSRLLLLCTWARSSRLHVRR